VWLNQKCPPYFIIHPFPTNPGPKVKAISPSIERHFMNAMNQIPWCYSTFFCYY